LTLVKSTGLLVLDSLLSTQFYEFVLFVPNTVNPFLVKRPYFSILGTVFCIECLENENLDRKDYII
jgi:hypothetical protein